MQFIDAHHQLLAAYPKVLDPKLVALSIFIAITSSFTAFGVAERINAAEKEGIKVVWIIFGAASMGLGVWTMHFIGQLALSLPIPVTYNSRLTVISMLPAVLVSCTVLWLMIHSAFNQVRLLACGIFLGLGICNMHFIGMMAMEFNADVLYVPNLLIIAVIIAVLFATVALYIQFDATTHSKLHVVGMKQVNSSVVMGFAVSGMYYVIMHATVFLPQPGKYQATETIDSIVLAYLISGVVFLILLLAIIIPFAMRYREMTFELREQEGQLRIAATAFQSSDAIVIADQKHRIIRVNDAFTRITGYQQAEVLGRAPDQFFSDRYDKLFFREIGDQLAIHGKWSGEIWNKHKNGNVYPTWQTATTIQNRQGEITDFVFFFSDITKLKRAERKIERLAFYDSLTDLPNRRLLIDHLEHEYAVAKRYQRYGALLFLDLDRFKHINDSLGHSVGDEILIITAQRLSDILRESDIAVRLGGDEYVLLIPAQAISIDQITSQARYVAEKIQAAINEPYYIAEHELYTSSSIGIALFNGQEANAECILKQADTAMYYAKDAGRNTFRFYLNSMQEAADARLLLEKALRKACANNEFNLHYQPQFALNGEIIGLEALLRWQHPELGLVSPAEFIPIAEETGLIVAIGEWVLNTVCRQLKEFEQQGLRISQIAVNISSKQFHHLGFVAMMMKILSEADLEPSRIQIEITEDVFISDFDEAFTKMNTLKQLGFCFTIDDFGTGYSSLIYLKRLPFEQLKINQSFVKDLLDNPSEKAIVKAIILMAKGLGLQLVAEGVETERHLTVLSNLGCCYFQGHYFSKPLPVDKLIAFYHQRPAAGLTESIVQ